jgi:hypothetical protein
MPNTRFVFVTHNTNHFNIMSPVARRLRDLKFPTLFSHPNVRTFDDRVREAIAAEKFNPAIPLNDFVASEANDSDIVVFGNDWNPQEVTSAVNALNIRGICTVGFVEGCRFGINNKYKASSRILAWGASAEKHFGAKSVVVGSHIVESARQINAIHTTPAVAINHKKHFQTPNEQDEWFEAVKRACESASLRFNVSAHPNSTDLQRHETTSLFDALCSSSILVTRPSTVVYEALFAGRAVVLFPHFNEPLGEFSDPKGSFGIVNSQNELTAALKRLRSQPSSYSDLRRFVDAHVSITEIPSADRAAQALLKIALEGNAEK